MQQIRLSLVTIFVFTWAGILCASEVSYDRATSLLPKNLKGLVKNESVKPHWFATGDSFWYHRDTDSGGEYVIVDAEIGEKKSAFDHERLAKAASAKSDTQVHSGQLQVLAMHRQDLDLKVNINVGGKVLSCETKSYTCSARSESSPIPAPQLLKSPNGELAAFVRENNLWIRSQETLEETQLTFDGEPFFGYGVMPDQYKLEEKRADTPFPTPPLSTHWSPDSSKLIVENLDERDVLDYPFLEMAPGNGSFRPVSYSVRIPLLGDSGDRITRNFVIDVLSTESSLIKLDEGFNFNYLGVGNVPISWSKDGRLAYLLAVNDGNKVAQLVELALTTGETRVVLQERSATSVALSHNVRSPNIRILENGAEAIWYSERDGWGHLYLYDIASGKLKHQITSGDWSVFDIVHIDEDDRVIFFTAGGREPGRDPYYRHLYRKSLDGGDVVLLTPENADHEFTGTSPMQSGNSPPGPSSDGPLSPSGRYFVDTYSKVDKEAVSVLRSAINGRLIVQLEQADASRLHAVGYRLPRRFSVLSADGQTELFGVMYLPSDFVAEKSYPLIDAIYGGPVSIVAARSFNGAYTSGYFPASVAELGFAVVTFDGRGTPFRSRAFREVGYGSFADPQLDDHVSALRQLAERYPFLDVSRVGLYGHSNGGYLAARALLKHPDFFQVGFASAGPHNFQGLPGTGTPWFGIPEYEDGSATRPEVNAIPKNYKALDNTMFADQLQGKLMLVCGELDYTVFPALTMQLAAALIKANKNFDFLYLPGSTHMYFVQDMYVTHRMWGYFMEHLAGQPPIKDFDMLSDSQ